ncbi:EthD family reductase [Paenibacillus humicola]|uniref:EthD family reductase n=1 Tax=Paenibacillus humicola TaxID=3110540 RepID=UPI00237A268B|nr:EthD family reductase [Paenibacillus humicola]
MFKMIVIYSEPKEIELFEAHYFAKHLPLIKQLPHLLDYRVQRVTNTQNTDDTAYLVTELEYADEASFNLSYTSAEGRAAQQDTADMVPYLHRLPVVHIVEDLNV